MIDKILKFLYGSLFFLTPLIFAPVTSELFEFNKMIFIYLITILVGFFWLLKMILAKKLIFKRTPLDVPILLFLLSQIASTIFSIDRHVSFFGYYGRFNGGLLSIVSYIVLYYGFVSNAFDALSLLKTSLLSSIVVIAYGLPGKLGHDLTCFLVTRGARFDNSCWDNEVLQFRPETRVFSTLGQPNWLGAYLAINFFIGLYFLLKNKNSTKYVILNVLYLISNFIFILFTRSRSALVAVGFGLAVVFGYAIFINRTRIKKIKKIYLKTIVVAAAIVVLVLGWFSFRQFANLKSQPSSNITESFDIRKIVWSGAVDLGLKYPFFGTGVETFAYSYNFVRPLAHNLTSEWDYIYNKAHNEFLNYLATTGFIGLLTYLIFIISFINYVINNLKSQISNAKTKSQMSKPKKDLKILDLDLSSGILVLSLFIAWLTILITNFFGFSTTTINLYFYFIPAFIVSLRVTNEVSNEAISFKKLFNYQYFFIFVLSISTIYLLFSTFAYWFADTQYALGVNYSKPAISDYQKSASYFERALKMRGEPLYEDRFSTSLSYLSVIATYQKQADLAKQLVALSDYYNKKSLAASPQNIFYWKTRAKNQYLFYQVSQDTKDLNEGVKALRVGERLAPTDPKIPYSLSVYYSLLYDAEKNLSQKEAWKKQSMAEIDRAIELKKDFVDGINLKKELQKKYSLL